jgi:tRNA (guanine37-N1)-methyltransferase
MRGNLKDVLSDKLKPEDIEPLYRSYDVVGDIAILRIPDALKHRRKLIAEALMQTQRHIKTVLHQTSPVSGNLRLRELEWISGEKKTETVHGEHGCLFKTNLESCFFSPRLSYERMRISQQARSGEVIINMFAGVGCYSVILAKHSAADKIYSVDINPAAVRYMRENIKINKVAGQVVPVEGDAKNIIERSLQNVADRVLMPLPQKAYEYLGSALLALKPNGGWIHYYASEHAIKGESPVEKTKAKALKRLLNSCLNVEVAYGRIVRSMGPNWYQVVLDVHLANLL